MLADCNVASLRASYQYLTIEMTSLISYSSALILACNPRFNFDLKSQTDLAIGSFEEEQPSTVAIAAASSNLAVMEAIELSCFREHSMHLVLLGYFL